jgi:Fe-S-cluster-containing dehydrogenase component
MQRTMFVEEDRCIGCQACIVACKLEHDLPPHPEHPPRADPKGPEPIRVLQADLGDGEEETHPRFRLIVCLHCLDAPCIPACPLSAIYKDFETGITLIHEQECTGCQLCFRACAWGAPQIHEGRLLLCDLCVHRIGEKREKGRETACEAACPAGAIHVGTADEICALIERTSAERAGGLRREARVP